MRIDFVTTFSVKGYHIYGQAFVDSWVEHVASLGHNLLIYHESQPNVDHHKLIDWRDINNLSNRRKFLEDHGNDPRKIGDRSNFNAQSIRFCHKVFALHDAARWSVAQWLVWVDADVIWTSKPDMKQLLPDDKSLCYLGRDPALNPQWKFGNKWRPICTETGFVGYRIENMPVRRMIEDMESYYSSGEIYERPDTDWHDAKCFDLCRERSQVPQDRWHSYSQDMAGTDVWPKTILARYGRHNKGDKRKAVAYGDISP